MSYHITMHYVHSNEEHQERETFQSVTLDVEHKSNWIADITEILSIPVTLFTLHQMNSEGIAKQQESHQGNIGILNLGHA